MLHTPRDAVNMFAKIFLQLQFTLMIWEKVLTLPKVFSSTYPKPVTKALF